MEKLKILVVEDNVVTAERIAMNLKKEGHEITEVVYSGGMAMLSVEENKPDLILMDIDLGGDLDGIQTAKLIKRNHELAIIYLTALDDTEVIKKAKKTDPTNFILKPFTIRRVNAAIQFAFVDKKTKKEQYLENNAIFIKDNLGYQKILIQDILFIQAERSYCGIYLKTGKKYTLSMNLTQFSKEFKHLILIRVSRKHIVNFKQIDRLEGNQIIIGGQSIPFSKEYIADIETLLRIIRRRKPPQTEI